MAGQGERLAADERALFSAALPAAVRGETGLAAGDRPQSAQLSATAGSSPTGRLKALSVPVRTLRAALETEAARGGAFLLAPVLFGSGALAYFALPREPGWAVLVAGLVLAAVAARLARGRSAAWAFAALLLILAGLFAGKMETWRAGTKIVGGEITTRLTGRVAVIEHRPNGRVRLTLDVLGTERPALRYRPDRVRVTARDIPRETRAGSVVTGVVRLLPPLGPLRPGSYDFAFESYFDGIGANGFFFRDPVLVASPPPAPLPQRFAAFIENARLKLAARIEERIGGAEGAVAAALVTGVRAGIPEDVNEALRITGLAHVLSISGLHMALVAGVFIGTLRLGFAFFPDFASRRPVRKYAAVTALIGVSFYLLLSGAEVAAQRSYLMIAVMLVALLFDRAALTMRNLAIAALAIIAVSPHEAAGPSFQMSFAATAALVAAYGWWAQRRARATAAPATAERGPVLRFARTVLFYAVGLAATSLIAGAATGIFGAWHFQRISPLGLAANLATMPIVSVLVMPFAVIGMALMPLDLDGWVFDVMGTGLRWMMDIARWLAVRSPIDVVGEIPRAAVLLLTLALLPLTVGTTAAVRWMAAPLLLAGAVLIAQRDLPDVFISENARLVGLRTATGEMAVNRSRPRAFTATDWQRAMAVERIVKPKTVESAAGLAALLNEPEQAETAALRPAGGEADRNTPPATGFVCAAELCMAHTTAGAIVAHAPDMPAALPACGVASLIVIADATAANPCPHTATVVVTLRHLALRGSATVSFGREGQPILRHAMGEEFRPWHDHRRFSREARGMPPWQPRPREAVVDEGKKGATTTAAGG